MRSPDPIAPRAPLRPLLAKELSEVLGGRALWTMLLLLCPLAGFSFFQAVSLYGEASAAARDQSQLASGLSPFDGIFVPTFGGVYLAVTLLFPFVAIRALGREKETGALRLLVQMPYAMPTLVGAKMIAIAAAWFIAIVPALSALIIWRLFGGHLSAPEMFVLLLGHLLYGLLVGAIALFAAAVCESSATAAIVALAFTIGSWVLDFTLAGQPGLLHWISLLSVTQALRSFEQGLLSLGLVVGVLTVIAGFAALAAAWLHPGTPLRIKLTRSLACVMVVVLVLLGAPQLGRTRDLTEDRRNSFPVADQTELAKLPAPLLVTVHLVPEDPRYVDLRRNVLAKLERVVPKLTIKLDTTGQTVIGSTADESYGEIEYSYGGRAIKTRSTSHREALPLIYELAGVPIPAPVPGQDYPGYPLVARGELALPWFFGVLPLLIGILWWSSRRAPAGRPRFIANGGQA